MSYKLLFHEIALKEWRKLDSSIQLQFKKQLAKRLKNPHIRSAKLRGRNMKNVYKIKLREAGYRLVYEVSDEAITVFVLAIGQRNKDEAYRSTATRHTLLSQSK